jgi:Cu2+-exporting ATPase
MTCCPTGLTGEPFAGDLDAWIRTDRQGLRRLDLLIPGMDCAACIPRIEDGIGALPGIRSARANLTSKCLGVTWAGDLADPSAILDRLRDLGFEARPFDPAEQGFAADEEKSRELLRAVAVSGFATANIMLLSVSVWSGAEAATRDLFHWISALIALPTVIYAGRPFFRGAARALAAGHLNMDVPISLAVCLAALMSLFATFNHGEMAYFDASVTLLFFLLTGRYLDHLMRARARSAVSQLMSLAATSATVIDDDGHRHTVRAESLTPGMSVAVAAGERFPADGAIVSGESQIDRSLVTGETTPEHVKPGAAVNAGMMNLTGPLTVRVTATGDDTFLAEVVRLMAAAEQGRSRFVQIADRLARFYSPAVHILAASTLAAWLAWTGGDWHTSLMVALAVLIITCPCALGLAVPAVQVVASGVLFRNGVMIKDGAALEKLAAVDTVIFDKTGTLTLGRPRLIGAQDIPADTLALAAGLAQASRHPLSRAICKAARERNVAPVPLDGVSEHPGFGLSATYRGEEVKLGSRVWCGMPDADDQAMPELVLKTSRGTTIFTFEDERRPQAAEAIEALGRAGLAVEILSGDRAPAVRRVAGALGIAKWQAGVTPREKLDRIEALAAKGRRVMMVGDGLNDAPALAAGFTSMAPSSATDIGRTAADTVFLSDSLKPLLVARGVAVRARRLSLQNFGLAIAYNVLAVPIAMLGFATPLIAAIAMSTSSLIVVANALRLAAWRPA